jgi:hypothetical protein
VRWIHNLSFQTWNNRKFVTDAQQSWCARICFPETIINNDSLLPVELSWNSLCMLSKSSIIFSWSHAKGMWSRSFCALSRDSLAADQLVITGEWVFALVTVGDARLFEDTFNNSGISNMNRRQRKLQSLPINELSENTSVRQYSPILRSTVETTSNG